VRDECWYVLAGVLVACALLFLILTIVLS